MLARHYTLLTVAHVDRSCHRDWTADLQGQSTSRTLAVDVIGAKAPKNEQHAASRDRAPDATSQLDQSGAQKAAKQGTSVLCVTARPFTPAKMHLSKDSAATIDPLKQPLRRVPLLVMPDNQVEPTNSRGDAGSKSSLAPRLGSLSDWPPLKKSRTSTMVSLGSRSIPS